MNPETTSTIWMIVKILGVGFLLCIVPFLLSGLAGLLENLFCNGDGSCTSNVVSVLFAASLGLVRGLMFAWMRVRSTGSKIGITFTGPMRRWSDPFDWLSFNVPYDVAELLTYLEAWMKAPLYVIGGLMLLKVFTVPFKLMIVPIAVAALAFSYAAYVYTALLAASVLFPVLILLFCLYCLFLTVFVKGVLVDNRGNVWYWLK